MSRNGNANRQSIGGLKEIREIIYGDALRNMQEQIEELKKENKTLKQNIKANENELLKSINEITALKAKQEQFSKDQNSADKLIGKLKQELELKINNLEASKIGKNQIGQAFIEWGMKVKQDDNS